MVILVLVTVVVVVSEVVPKDSSSLGYSTVVLDCPTSVVCCVSVVCSVSVVCCVSVDCTSPADFVLAAAAHDLHCQGDNKWTRKELTSSLKKPFAIALVVLQSPGANCALQPLNFGPPKSVTLQYDVPKILKELT